MLMCSVQTYYLYQAANTIPASYNEGAIFRYDCLDSIKGGKISKIGDKNRPGDSLNPCFCHAYARCYVRNHATGTIEEIPPADCP